MKRFKAEGKQTFVYKYCIVQCTYKMQKHECIRRKPIQISTLQRF